MKNVLLALVSMMVPQSLGAVQGRMDWAIVEWWSDGKTQLEGRDVKVLVGHLSRILCLSAPLAAAVSFGLESGLEHSVELIEHGGDVSGDPAPSTGFE